MKRPAILGEDVAVVPREATIEMECRVDHEDCTTPDAAKSAFRDMLAASPHATAWAEVKAYVEWLENEIKKTKSDRDGWQKIVGEIASGVPIPHTIAATGTVSDMISYFNGVASRAEAAEARLKEAELVIAPFADAADVEDSVGRDDKDDDRVLVSQAYGCLLIETTIGHLRSARTWMEGKK